MHAILALTIKIKGQSPQENLDKYWDYRALFFDNFIVDIDPSSLPTGMEEYGINIPATRTTNDDVFWGEAPIKLGYYLSAMATEYKLKRLNNLDGTIAQEKIYRALNAVNRLDSYAEPYFGCGYSGDPPCYDYTNINGFFIRDDVYDNFVLEWSTYKPSWQNKQTESNYSSENDLEMSQDMICGLMMGHSLVKRFVDAQAQYEDFPCDNITLNEMARRQTYRSIKYMQTWWDENDWTWKIYGDDDYPGKWVPAVPPPLFPLIPIPVHLWEIKNPCLGSPAAKGNTFDIYHNSTLFESAGNWLTGEDLNYFALSPYIISLLGIPAEYMPDLSLPYAGGYFNSRMKLELSTIANDHYASDLDELFCNMRKCADDFNENITGNPYDCKYFWMDNLPMMSVLLHDIDPQCSDLFFYYYSHIEQLLNDAPEEGIIIAEWPSDDYIWFSNSMLDRPIGEYRKDSSGYRPGTQNGLDYMILFNLYHLVYQTNFDDPITITEDFPTTYTYDPLNQSMHYGGQQIALGHEDNSATYSIHSKQEIEMNSTVESDGKIRLVGNTIILTAGFEIESGGEFIAESNSIMDLDFTPPQGSSKSAFKNNTSINRPEEVEYENITTQELYNDKVIDHLSIFPNPTNGIVTISSDSNFEFISVFNSEGRLVSQSDCYNETTIQVDLSTEKAGLYYISIFFNDGTNEYYKILKN